MLLSLVQPPYHGIVCSDMSRSPDERLDTRGGWDPPCPHTPSGKEPARGRARRRLRFLRHRRADERQRGSRRADHGRPLLPPLHAVGGRTHRGANYPAPSAGRRSFRRLLGDHTLRSCRRNGPVRRAAVTPPATPPRHLRERHALHERRCSRHPSGEHLRRPLFDRSRHRMGARWRLTARGPGTGHVSSHKPGAPQRSPHPQESTNHVFAPTAHTAGRWIPCVPRRRHLHHLAQRR